LGASFTFKQFLTFKFLVMANRNDGGQQGGQGNRGGQGKSDRGFAGMDPEKQREIAKEGGKASHEQGTGHEFTSNEAREAGKKGGQNSGGSRGGER
jgi:general stress protein YciG